MAKRCKGWIGLVFAIASGALGVTAIAARAQSVADWADVLNLGATFSVYSYGQAPYNRAAPFLRLEDRVRFSEGAKAFAIPRARDVGIASSIAPTASANAPSCGTCHFMDGRGRAHSADLGVTGVSVVNHGQGVSAPVFRKPAASDVGAARLTDVRWVVADRILLSGEETIELVTPVTLVDGVEQPVDLRNAPAVYGLGLLESIPDADIIAHGQARAFARFGITGLVPLATGAGASVGVGRFGWKATFATLSDQVRHAVTAELGIVDLRHPNAPGGENPHFAALIEDMANYLRLLAVPTRRLTREGVHRPGAEIFEQIGCTFCHVPFWRTGKTDNLAEKYRDLIIYPFTDMLLHDMGEKLSDLSGAELSRYWRTPPLWGIGVQHSLSLEVGFLHDGRARTLTEAILWHGGEAQYAVDRFNALTSKDRANLIAFLSSL